MQLVFTCSINTLQPASVNAKLLYTYELYNILC